jgi:phosphoenolpyruvate carboxylase
VYRAHFKYGIKAEHYKHLNDAVVATMEASLGEAWDEDQEEAWGAFMGLLMAVVNKAYAGGVCSALPLCYSGMPVSLCTPVELLVA